MPPRTPFVNPWRYYEREDRPSLAVAAGAVVVVAVSVPLTARLVVELVSEGVEFAVVPAPEPPAVGVPDALGLLAAPVVVAAALHAFVWFADGEGGFGTTLAVVGEAALLDLLLVVPLAVFALSAPLALPAEPVTAREFARLMDGPTSLFRALLWLAALAAVAWKAGVRAVGLAEVHDVSPLWTATVAGGLGLLTLSGLLL